MARDCSQRLCQWYFGILCRDCWSVAFGNSYNDEERCVLAGYDNGDVKLFDLRMNQVGLSAVYRLQCAYISTCQNC